MLKRYFNTDSILKSIIVIISCYYIFSYVFIALIRLNYPFEIEWMEGGTIIHIDRIMKGLPVYKEPGIDFIPAIYTPLYYYVSLISVKFWGLNFFSIRLVSFISSLLTGIIIYLIIRKFTANKFFSFVGLSFFFASFKACGAWFDVGRVDSLAILFVTTAILFILHEKFIFSNILSPLFFLLAYFTKQNTIIIALFVITYLFFYKKSSLKYFILTLFIPLIILHFLLNENSNGWFNYYTVVLSNSLDNKYQRLFTFWVNDIIKNLPIGIIFILIIPLLEKEIIKNFPKYFYLFLSGLVIMSLLSRLKTGGYENALIPAFIGIIILFIISISFLQKVVNKKYSKLFLIAIIIQYFVLYYPVSLQLPTNDDRKTGKKLLDLISSFEGEVFCPDHPYYLLWVGKNYQAQTMAISDFINSSKLNNHKMKLISQINDQFKDRKFDAIILDRKDFFSEYFNFDKYYKLENSNLTGNHFIPLTGAPNKPQYLYIKF